MEEGTQDGGYDLSDLQPLLRTVAKYIVVAPVYYFIWKLLQSFPTWRKLCTWCKRSFWHLLACLKAAAQLWPIRERVQPSNAERQQERAVLRRGGGGGGRGGGGRKDGGGEGRRRGGGGGAISNSPGSYDSIRRFLCNDTGCMMCDEATKEVLLRMHRRNRHGHSLHPVTPQEHPVCEASFLEEAARSNLEAHLADICPRIRDPSFLATKAKKDLEQHLKRMTQERAWRLPQRMQKATRLFESRGKKTPSPTSVPHQHPKPRAHDPKAMLGHRGNLQGHMMRKCMALRMESIPGIVARSQEWTDGEPRNLHLPKLLCPGQTYLQQRSRLCLSLRGKGSLVDMNIKCKHIHLLWGPPTIQMQSLAKMVASPPALKAVSRTQLHFCIKISDLEPAFISPEGRKVLESHVLRKRLQHHWGQPGLVQRSLRQFLLPVPAPPLQSAAVGSGQHGVKVVFDPSFVHSGVKQLLELHLKRKIIERSWGRPQRVLESLRGFFPVSPPPTKGCRKDGRSLVFSHDDSMEMRVPSTMIPAASLREHCPLLCWEWKSRVLQAPLAKKVMEIQLGRAAPAMQRPPERAPRVLLPKGLSPGERHLQRRHQDLLFMDRTALERIQLNLVHKGLAYRWGLPTIHQASLAQLFQGVASPKMVIDTFSPRRRGQFRFAAQKTPFMAQETRNLLEWHVRSKFLHHTWGLPRLVQKSLQGLLPDPGRIHPQKTMSKEQEAISLRELSFISEAAQALLERNVAQRVIHQQWGLPGRALHSIKSLFQETRASFEEERRKRVPLERSFPGEPSFEGTYPEPWYLDVIRAKQDKRETKPMAQHCLLSLRTQVLATLKRHLLKKSLEAHLGCLPVVPTMSWQDFLLALRHPLPKTLRPGVRPLEPRIPSLSFGQEKMGRIEVALWGRHLASLWGLGTKYVEAVAGMGAPRLPMAPLQTRRAILGFVGTEMPFPQGPAREMLERHVRKKKVQHEWGLPSLVQRSLWGFMGETPTVVPHPQTKVQADIVSQELLFLPRSVCHHLEVHLQKMKLCHKWGLPQRILESTKHFLPIASTGRAPNPHRAKGKDSFGEESSTGEAQVEHVKRMQGKGTPLQKRSGMSGPFRRSTYTTHQKDVEFQPVGDFGMSAFFPREPFLPLASLSQDEKGIPHTQLPQRPCSHVLPGATYYSHSEAGGPPDPITRTRRVPPQRHSTVDGSDDNHLLLRPRGHPMEGAPDVGCHKGITGAKFLPEKAWQFLELHIRDKRIQHEWRLPSLVRRSLRAFAPLPHGTQRNTKAGGALQDTSGKGGNKTLREQQTSVLEDYLASYQLRHLLDEELQHCLETHVRDWVVEHKWALPKQIQDLVKAIPAPQPQEPIMGGIRVQHGYSQGQGFHSRSNGKGDSVPLPVQSRRRAPERPKEPIRKETPGAKGGGVAITSLEAKPSFLTEGAWDLLEFHVASKKVHHLWGLPSSIVRSLHGFAPFPLEKEAKTKPGSTAEVETILQKPLFLNLGAKECLEAHLQSLISRHRWGLPRRTQQAMKGWSSKFEEGPPLQPFAPDADDTEDDHGDPPKKATSRRWPRESKTPSESIPVSFTASAQQAPFRKARTMSTTNLRVQQQFYRHTFQA